MTRRLKNPIRPWRVGLLWLLASPLVQGTPTAPGATHAQELTDRDEAVLQDALVQGITMGIPGLSVALGVGDEVVWTGTAGYRDLRDRVPVTPDDRFGVGSITKTFVARVILQLAQEGRVELDRPPTDYVDRKSVV